MPDPCLTLDARGYLDTAPDLILDWDWEWRQAAGAQMEQLRMDDTHILYPGVHYIIPHLTLLAPCV
jgi:hypothetical protein